MNEGPDFQPPTDDDAQDPLLRALREHLGAGFGQAPPPRLWAAIQGQLPARPRPWWRRTRRLLPLLALLAGVLLVGTLAVRHPGWHVQAGAANPAQPAHPALGQKPNGQPLASHYEWAGRPAAATRRDSASQPATAATNLTAAAAAAAKPARTGQPLAATPLAGPIAANLARRRPQDTAAPTAAAPRKQVGAFARLPGGAGASQGLGLPAAPGRARQRARAGTGPGHPQALAASRRALRPAVVIRDGAALPAAQLARAARHRPAQRRRALARAVPAPAPAAQRPPGATLAVGSRRPDRHPTYPLDKQETSSSASGPARGAGPGTAGPDSLSRRGSLPAVASLALPAPLPPRPDSSAPWLPPVRRWSVLVLAGPTLSYRALGAAGTTATPVTNSTSAASSSAAGTAALERPAAGYGAQVQARRILSGRWALALGAGYQEYATRLALQLTRQAQYSTSPSNGAKAADSSFAVHERDTYRLLTLPVQLGYALGPPRGRWSLGLLAGLEPGLYLGGRTTEGSSCNCQQQSFSSASGSPYHQLSLALSLGLDARYRLGGPASRWQWVLQPTGRYVATPFVRGLALGYAQRQPYSLGLLTGLAWAW